MDAKVDDAPRELIQYHSLRLGVSACLLGAKVRFDGGHKRNHFLLEELGTYFEFVPFCPEVAIGMGTPRPTIRLAGDVQAPRAVGSKDTGLDVTDALQSYSASTARRLDGLSGFVFKKDSPTCGMERVKVYSDKGMPQRDGVGIFARALQEVNPLLPVEEEGRLNAPVLRENFISRVFVYARWQALQRQGLSKKGLVDFHARHKLLLMAHSPAAYRELGRMLAWLDNAVLDTLADRYIARVMQALKLQASSKRHVNVLQHLRGYLRKRVDAASRADLVDVIDSCRRGVIPLVVPITLLQHYFRRDPRSWISQQVYMSPHPRDRIPGFTLYDHHFLPGFPEMAWPMLDWVLDRYYPALGTLRLEKSVRVLDVCESDLLELMRRLSQQHVEAELFSLPRMGERNSVEIGFRGAPAVTDAALSDLMSALQERSLLVEAVPAES